MERTADILRLAGILLAALAAIAGLHAVQPSVPVDWQRLDVWLQTTPIELATAAVLRLVALAGAYWLAGSTALYTGATLARIPSAVRAVEWATLPTVQRLARRAAALSLATGMAAPVIAIGAPPPPPAFVEAPPSPVTSVDDEAPDERGLLPGLEITVDAEGIIVPPGIEAPGYTFRPAGKVPDAAPGTAPGTPGAVPTASTAVEPAHGTRPLSIEDRVDAAGVAYSRARTESRHTVVRGDHLWGIAEHHLATTTGENELSDAEIAAYWAGVVAENRHRLASGNPDVIHPGEVIVLPPVEGA